jgi:hypothetical protein
MRITILSGITLLFLPLLLWSYSGGPPDDVACNPPFFDSCVMCHSSFPENSGDGSYSIFGVPANYTPGATYNITVTIEDPGQEKWGFELTTQDTADCQAGVLIVTDPDSTQLSNNTGCNPDYIMQTSLGTHTGVLNGPVSWRFDWQAPGSGTGTVTFYSAGLAANDAAGTNGDYVYCTSVSTDELTTVHDGGVISLQAPDTVCMDSTSNLCVTVENFGNVSDTFVVISTVDGFTDTTVVPDLAPGDSSTICFNWTPVDTGNFNFTSCTQVQGDTNSANNCDNMPIVSIICVGIEEIELPSTRPELTGLYQNTPNPFKDKTEIRYTLQERASVTLGVFDISGQRIKSLVNGFMDNGVYSVIWDGKDERGIPVSSGIYFYRLTAGELKITNKLIYLK